MLFKTNQNTQTANNIQRIILLSKTIKVIRESIKHPPLLRQIHNLRQEPMFRALLQKLHEVYRPCFQSQTIAQLFRYLNHIKKILPN